MPTASAPKNPEVVHLNGRLLYQSTKRNILMCNMLSLTVLVITCAAFEYGYITSMLVLFAGLAVPLVCIGWLLSYLIKICFIDGAMGSLIIRGNKNQPVTL